MRKAITISILFHIALLTWALGYFASSDTPKPVAKITVPVDILTPSQFTKIKAGKKEAKKIKKPAVVKKKKPAKKPVKKIVKKPAPKKPVRVAKKVEPKTIAKAKPKPKLVKKKIVKAKKRIPNQVQKKPVPKKVTKRQSEFDPENIAALLNKLPDQKPAPKSSYKVKLEPAPRAQRQARLDPPNYGRRYGADDTMSANEIDAFKAQISQCWRPPTGGLGSRDLNVKLRIKFKLDGTLEKPPELANFSGSPFFRPAAEAAKRAVWQCQPYRMPKDKFATWQDMILNFDPRDMFGG
ncbi:MAG: hypothetical protein GY927_22610 [bacterium]|nr:hypothetical protein [bacterium]